MRQCVFNAIEELLGFADDERQAEMVVQSSREEGMYYEPCPDLTWEEVIQHGEGDTRV